LIGEGNVIQDSSVISDYEELVRQHVVCILCIK